MTQHTYMKLPINANEGFPQAFRLNFKGSSYQVLLYVNIAEEVANSPHNVVYELPTLGAFMVMRVAREESSGPQVFFQRKLVPNLEYETGELAFLFREIRVAKRNLNGAGVFGSSVIGGVAARWAS